MFLERMNQLVHKGSTEDEQYLNKFGRPGGCFRSLDACNRSECGLNPAQTILNELFNSTGHNVEAGKKGYSS